MKSKEEVIARLILSTKRKNREFHLIDIADDIDWLKHELGSLDEVAKIIGISTGMLNQFLRAKKLTKKLQELVKRRKIDSVDMVHNLCKFSPDDQDVIGKAIADNKINTRDLRYLSPLRKEFPNERIDTLLDKVVSSKNIKVSVIKFKKEDLLKSYENFKKDIESIVLPENLLALITDSNICEIKLTKEGEKLLRLEAKHKGKSLKDYIISILR